MGLGTGSSDPHQCQVHSFIHSFVPLLYWVWVPSRSERFIVKRAQTDSRPYRSQEEERRREGGRDGGDVATSIGRSHAEERERERDLRDRNVFLTQNEARSSSPPGIGQFYPSPAPARPRPKSLSGKGENGWPGLFLQTLMFK